jgi:astacin (peptidase family M12A)/ricin-type beta-trefoil lectin protein
MASMTWRARWRRVLPRLALALGLLLTGSAGLIPDVQAAHAVLDRPWSRRPMRWGNGGCRVAYQMETQTAEVRDTVYQVINYINATTPCRWEPVQWWDWNYVAFTENDSDLFDWAAHSNGIGMVGGRQEVQICHSCNNFKLILHEMGHAMGLKHEHQRWDRDYYINVYYATIQSDRFGDYDPVWESTLGTPYDVRSVMHYGKTSFIRPEFYHLCLWWGINCTMDIKGYPQGELSSTYFTDTDLKGLNRFYPMPNQLVAMHSGKCIDMPGGNGSAGTIVQQFDCHEGSNQGWLLRWDDNDGSTDYYLLESSDPGAQGMCLDVQWASQNPGAPVMMWPCSRGAASQQWSVTPTAFPYNGYWVRARHSGQCLDVSWASQDNGATIVQSTCWGGTNQIWGKSFRPERLVREQPDPRCGNPRDPC